MAEHPVIVLDGRDVPFEPGQSVLEAARAAGVPIPTLCYDPRVTSAGACRLCVVEQAGVGRPVAACATPAFAGQQVTTDSPRLRELRRGILELVLSEQPPTPCRRCEEIGRCELHELADRYDADPRRVAGDASGQVHADPNPFIDRGYDQCIACYRCTRVCNELEHAHAIAPAGRGFGSRIASLFDKGLLDTDCSFCGQCVNTCPTGALTLKTRDRSKPHAALSNSTKTTCAFCGTGCTLYLDVADNRIVGVRGDPDSPVSRGSLCVKGQFGWDFVSSPERLTTPLIRGPGGLRPATWDEALDLVATRFAAIKADHGPNSMVVWSSARSTTESNYVIQKFTRAVLGTNNIDNCART